LCQDGQAISNETRKGRKIKKELKDREALAQGACESKKQELVKVSDDQEDVSSNTPWEGKAT